MNVLFLTLIEFDTLQEENIYTDLLREFVGNGHSVFVISPVERRKKIQTHMVVEKNARILRLQIGNIQKTNIIEKGISTILIEPIFKNAIKKYYSDVEFDLVLYSTPPITLVSAIEYIKKRDEARTYLLLKDIFPQNAVDIGLLSTIGIKGLLYKHFRKQEKRLYKISDYIGCMSQANVEYVIKHNSDVDISRVEVSPNSIEVVDKSVDSITRNKIRTKYGIPLDKTVFVYGGNLGLPQGIPFIIDCLKSCKNIYKAFFLLIGDGTEYSKLESFVENSEQTNVILMKRLPKTDYDSLVGACDVGMIFLDHRFTIPNFPSRLLSYMQAKLPVLAVTDPNTDVGKLVSNEEFGWWCESNDSKYFADLVNEIICKDLYSYKEKSFQCLNEKFNVRNQVKSIVGRMDNL